MRELRSLGPSGTDPGLAHAALQGVGYSSLSATPTSRLPTGFDDVDRVTGGGLSTGVHLLAGEPGSGRTGLAVTLAMHAANAGHPVLVVCKADDSVAFTQRMICGHTRIDRAKLVDNVDPHRQALDQAAEHLARLPVLVAESERVEPWRIGWALRELTVTATRRPRMVIVDDLDHLASTDASWLRQIGRSLSDLARSIDTTIVVATTVQPPLGDRHGHRPERHHANGWTELAPYLRSAWLLYRDELHDHDSPDASMGELILAWHANGPTGTIKLAYLAHLGVWAGPPRQPRT